MLRSGCRSWAVGSALRCAGRHAAPAVQGGLLVLCGPSSSGPGGDGGPGRLTPDQQRRALSVLGGAKQIAFGKLDFRKMGNQLGGTLIVDDASHKGDVQKAVKDGTISFGFSAGGCLFPYYIGVAGALMDGGILTEGVKVGGASAGSLLAACLKSGMPLDDVVEQNLRLMSDLRQGGTRGRLGSVVRHFLDQSLPEDAHAKCRDKAYVAVTRITPIARPALVSDWSDRQDLIQSLITSCHIPFWLDGNAFTEFRGERACDGGLTNFIPLPPETVGIRVCCFPSKQLSPVYRIGISPDSFEPWDYTLRQMVQWAFEPADEAIVAALIDKGKRDAQDWMESMELVGESREVERKAEQDVGHVAAAKEAALGTADSSKQQAAQEAGEQKLEERAQRDVGGGAGAAAPAAAMKEQQAVGAAGGQRQAVEAAAWRQEEEEEEAERALREAEEREGEGGNLWARALGAAGVAASAAAVAAAVTSTGGL